MKALLRFPTLCLLLLVPLSTAHAQAPLLSPIANVSLNAGSTLNVNVVAVDENGQTISITAALPPFATLNTPTVGAGVVVTSLTLAPSAAHVGDFTAAVTATAGGVPSVRVFQITVNAAGSNQAPRVIAPPMEEVTAGLELIFLVRASDPDGMGISSLSASGLPAGATFAPNMSNTTGTFFWTPGPGDAGEYDILFSASNDLSASAVTHIRVASPPTLAITPIADVTVAGGNTLSVPVHASGVSGAFIALTAALPTFATLNPPGTGTSEVNTTITLAPPVGSAGTYHASVTATSLGVSFTELFDIVVTGPGQGNRAPILTAPVAASVAIGATLSFDVTATDPDGDHVELIDRELPEGSSFVDNGNNTGTFTWSPVLGQEGPHIASFTGLDNRGGSGIATTSITVTGDTPENNAPTLSAPATEQVDEGVNLSFTVTASDQDGDPVALSANAVPAGATFTDHGNNTGTFAWTPDTTQSGTYVVSFLGDDGNGGTGTASTTITVQNVGGNGGGDAVAKACLVGNFKHNRESTCFRIKPIDRSFDLADVVLSSIRLQFNGESIPALEGAHIDRHCHGRGGHRADGAPAADGAAFAAASGHGADGGHGGGRDDDDDDGGGGHGDDDDDDGGGGHGDDDDDDGGGQGPPDKCNVSCPNHHDHDGDGCWKRGGECDTLGIRVCFSTDALLQLLVGANGPARNGPPSWKQVPCALVDAEILATLTSGATVVATFNDRDHRKDHGDDDDDDGGDAKGDGSGKDAFVDDEDGRVTRAYQDALGAKVMPNPLNPGTELSFTMTRDSRVHVAVYDMQGRVVKTLLNDFRSAGQQRLTWDGSSERSSRVPSGVYFIRIRSLEASVIQRVTVVN